MTLRLVSENPEPQFAVQFAGQARQLANDIEAGKYGDVTRVALAIEYDGGLHTEGWGGNVNPYDMMGLFEAAKLVTFAESAEDL